jgi:hypothetical protein
MTATAHHPHRVAAAVAGVRAELTGVADAPVWSMGAVETAATIDELDRAEAQLAELKARLLNHGDFVAVAGSPRSSTSAARNGSTPKPSASSKPSRPAAAK